MAKSVEDKVADLRALLKKVQREVFEVGPLPEGMQALERLLCLVIQGDIALATAEKAVRALKAKYSNWNEVRVAREFEVRDVFVAKRIPAADERAELVQEYLRRIFGLQNHLELDWAYDATSERREKLLNSIQMAPPQAGAVLDLDAVEDGGVPIHADLKRLFSRLGLVKVNPRDAQVMELLEPLVGGEELYPNYVALRLVAALGCDPKHPKSRKAQLLKEIWDARHDRVTTALNEKMDELGLPPKKAEKKAPAAKKTAKAPAKQAAAKKAAKKAPAKKAAKKATKKATKKAAKKTTRKKAKVSRK